MGFYIKEGYTFNLKKGKKPFVQTLSKKGSSLPIFVTSSGIISQKYIVKYSKDNRGLNLNLNKTKIKIGIVQNVISSEIVLKYYGKKSEHYQILKNKPTLDCFEGSNKPFVHDVHKNCCIPVDYKTLLSIGAITKERYDEIKKQGKTKRLEYSGCEYEAYREVSFDPSKGFEFQAKCSAVKTFNSLHLSFDDILSQTFPVFNGKKTINLFARSTSFKIYIVIKIGKKISVLGCSNLFSMVSWNTFQKREPNQPHSQISCGDYGFFQYPDNFSIKSLGGLTDDFPTHYEEKDKLHNQWDIGNANKPKKSFILHTVPFGKKKPCTKLKTTGITTNKLTSNFITKRLKISYKGYRTRYDDLENYYYKP